MTKPTLPVVPAPAGS